MISKFRKAWDKIYIKEEYDYVMDEICENNRKFIIILCSICAIIFAILTTLGFLHIGIEAKDVPVFLGSFICAVLILLFINIKTKHRYKITMIATYLTMTAIVLYGLIISYRVPDGYTVTFIAMMCIMSMTFVDRPVRIGIAHILATGVCVVMIAVRKEQSVRVGDLVNVISFSFLSFIGGFYTVKTKVHGYVMDKLHEENIKKERQKLNEKEVEALELLTAVKATHDMIVSVNLTQNIYTLIGNESFVTQGDDVTGVFDEVIEIHANKVVPEHRQRYIDTFSRASLLRAYEKGEKEVYLEYQQCDENGVPHWLGTHTMFIENPNSADVTEITVSQNLDERVKMQTQYDVATNRKDFLETMAANLPGGYHRCTTDHDFRLTFISNSFTEITGYTKEQLRDELNDSYMGIVAPEDREYFLSLAPQLEREGHINCAYRMRRRDGSIRWVQDSTQYVERDGEQYYQCALSDIHDIVIKQEELARQVNLLDVMEKNMPGGYHRCADAEGWPFLYISSSFIEVTGWSKEEIESEFNNLFINMVLPEDIPLCAGIIEEIKEKGYSTAMYRLKKKGGGHIWVSDSTMRVELDNESFFHGVLADVSNQIEEMERAKQEAVANSQAKSTFLFNISHDIRTPMNAIRGFSHIIEQNADNPELVVKTIGKVKHAGDSLIMLVNDVLDISRIERGKEELNLQPMDLCAHSKNLYEMFVSEMNVCGIEFEKGGEELHDYVYCDELKLTRIMMNMLSNARKFTPKGGRVTFGGVRLQKDEKTCTYRFFVRDTGIGMSKEFQKKAFEQFERERTSTESGVAGSGLGLSIIKMLVDLMGGRVEIESEPGKGTEISAIITLTLADEAQMTEVNAKLQSTPDMSGKRVMLVEDNEFNREIAKYVLEDMQLNVDEAENGAVCIEKLMSAEMGYYDVILMDIQMPVMDGYTATVEIRNLADRAKAATPIIAMTANAFEEDKKKCLEVGMNGHIGKPIDVNEVRKALLQILNR